MKYIFSLFLPLLFLSSSALAATNDIRYGRHIFNFPIELQQCTLAGGVITGSTPQKIDADIIFTIVNIINDDYIIQISRFTNGANIKEKNETLVARENGEEIYFKLPKSSYDTIAEALAKKGNFTVGAATTLIKIRPGRRKPKNGYTIYSEFGNDFNIGLSAGWKIKPNRRYPSTHSVVGGLSFSSIKATPYTTKDYLSSETTQSCVTLSSGYIFEYEKFQFCLFTGIDLMPGQIGRNWIYTNRPWLGLGFGFQIFRADGETAN